MTDVNFTVATQWAEARQLLTDAGMGGMTVTAAVAQLLPRDEDTDD